MSSESCFYWPLWKTEIQLFLQSTSFRKIEAKEAKGNRPGPYPNETGVNQRKPKKSFSRALPFLSPCAGHWRPVCPSRCCRSHFSCSHLVDLPPQYQAGLGPPSAFLPHRQSLQTLPHLQPVVLKLEATHCNHLGSFLWFPPTEGLIEWVWGVTWASGRL